MTPLGCTNAALEGGTPDKVPTSACDILILRGFPRV